MQPARRDSFGPADGGRCKSLLMTNRLTMLVGILAALLLTEPSSGQCLDRDTSEPGKLLNFSKNGQVQLVDYLGGQGYELFALLVNPDIVHDIRPSEKKAARIERERRAACEKEWQAAAERKRTEEQLAALFSTGKTAESSPCNDGAPSGIFTATGSNVTLPLLGDLVKIAIFQTGKGPSAILFFKNGQQINIELQNNGATWTAKSFTETDGMQTLSGSMTVQVDNGVPKSVDVNFTSPSTATYNSTLSPSTVYTAAPCTTTAELTDPISTATGELIETPVPDLDLGGPLPLRFLRYYSTYLNLNGDQSAVGYNWMHNFDSFLSLGANTASIMFLGGTRITFQQTDATWQTLYPARRAYQLITSGSTYRFLDPLSNLIYTFSSTTGSLLKIEDRNGNALTVTPSQIGPTQVSDGLGRTLSFSYANGFLTKVQDQSGRSVSFSHTGNDLTGVTDALGNSTTFTYVPGDLLTKTVRPNGNAPYTQIFDSTFRVVQQTDSLGNTTSLAYNSGGTPGVTLLTDPLSHTFVTKNNPDPLTLSSFTDAAGKSGSFTYDLVRRPSSYTDRLGNKWTIAYDPASGYPAFVTDPQGKATAFLYQAQQQGEFTFYNLMQVAFPDGTSNSFTYDASGNILTAIDGAGKTRKYTYNSRGQVLTATNPAGGVTTLTYNADGTVATRQDPAGNVTTFSYDNLKRLASILKPDQSSVSFTRDGLDQILSVTDERGKVTRSTYDGNMNLKSVTDPLHQTSTLSHDTDDLPSSVTDPLGNSTIFKYDPLGSVTGITNAAGEKTTYTYDNLERVQSALDPSGKGSSFTYDAEGRLATLTDALGNTAKFTVDQLGRTTGVSSPSRENTAIGYDALSRVTSITDPLSRSTSFSYENRGLPVGINAPGGLSTGFTWGDLRVLTSFTDPNGNKWPVSHDSLGRLTSITDPLGHALAYAYDRRNRVSSVSSTADSVQITYDAAGNAVQAKYSDGSSVAYIYDDDNRLTGGTGLSFAYDGAGRMTSSNGLAVSYDPVGRIRTVAYPPGKVTYFYDTRGLLAQVSDWAGGGVAFKFDDAHRLVSASRTNGVTTAYSYDKNGSVISILETGGGKALASINLTRDALGRVTASNRNLPQEVSVATGILPLGYDPADQISGLTYDARGRLTKGDGGSTYRWNPASRLVSYARADGSASFTYDGLGQRISRTGPDGVAVNYVLNYALGLPSVTVVQSGKSDLRYYVYTPDGLLLYSIEASNGSHRFYSFDETGSTTFLTGDSGAVTDAYGISPYGDVITGSASNKTDNPFTWQGQFGVMQELGASLFYLRYRYYDSTFARFLSRDPLVSPAPREVNPYQYAAGNPVSNVDPTGLKSSNITEIQRGSGATAPLIPSASSIATANTTNDPTKGIFDNEAQPNLVRAILLFSPFLTFNEIEDSR